MSVGSKVLVAVAASLVLVLPGCGASEEKPPDLFAEYVRSTDVKNDRFSSGDAGSEDRLANFAARYTPEELQTRLLSAFPCDGDSEPDVAGAARSPTACDLNSAVREAAQDFAGADGEIFGRSILVKHEDGSLELITAYVARKADGTAVLIDATGETYRGGLDDFRQHNDLLDSDDWILAPRNVTAVPGEGEIVTVTGHTPSYWELWVGGGIGAMIVLAAVVAVVRRRARGAD